MNNTTSWVIIHVQDKQKAGLLTADQYDIITCFFVGACTIISLGGITANAVNIKTFISIGLKDGVTVSLLSLAVSDLGYCISSVIFGVSALFSYLEKTYDVIFPIDPFVVFLFIGNTAIPLYSITTMTTTYLAVARCMCVARPLHFKNSFTKFRSVVIQSGFVVFVMGFYAAPVLSQMGTKYAYDLKVNKTRIVLWLSDIREQVKDVVFIFEDTILSFATLFTVTLCVIILAFNMNKSAQFRNTKAASGGEGKESRYKLSGKDLQVVKQVVLISTIYIATSILRMFISVFAMVDPDFYVGKRLQRLYLGLSFFRNLCEVTNSASTFIIYYNYNSAFRADLGCGVKHNN